MWIDQYVHICSRPERRPQSVLGGLTVVICWKKRLKCLGASKPNKNIKTLNIGQFWAEISKFGVFTTPPYPSPAPSPLHKYRTESKLNSVELGRGFFYSTPYVSIDFYLINKLRQRQDLWSNQLVFSLELQLQTDYCDLISLNVSPPTSTLVLARLR